jgi:hypothetical protein
MIKPGGSKLRLIARLVPEKPGYVHMSPKRHSRKSQLFTTLADKILRAGVFGS